MDIKQQNKLALLNTATPTGGILFEKKRIDFGDVLASVYSIIKYPNGVGYGWLSKFTGLNEIVSCQVFEPINDGELMQSLSDSVKSQEGIAGSTRDELTRQRAYRAGEDAKRLINQIDTNNEVIGYMSNIAMIMGKNEQELEQNIKAFESRVASIGCRCRNLVNQQREGLQTISPWGVPKEEVLANARRNVPLSTFLGGFPFSSNGFSDRTGLPLGIDSVNGLIVLDLWKRGLNSDRTNSNGVILGVAGVGKSTAAKLIMINEFMQGTKIIVIDPEREYKDLAQNLGGDIIQAGGGNFKINPLEFNSGAYTAVDDEDALDLGGFSPLATHLSALETFFKLYQPSLTDMQISVLKRLLEDLYIKKFNIDWTTDVSEKKSDEYPIFSDLYSYANEYFESKKDDIVPGSRDLLVPLRELAMGSDSLIFNGYTSVTPKSNFISIDTSNLQNYDERIKKAQYFNILSYCWNLLSENREEKSLLFCDEAYLLCDPRVPQSLVFLRNVSKRARKYNSGLWVITHSAVDFLDPNIKTFGQALFDLPCYKIIMGTDGKNLAEISDLFNLTEAEQDRLIAKRKTEAILFIGAKRIACKINVADYKLNLMGSGGGR